MLTLAHPWLLLLLPLPLLLRVLMPPHREPRAAVRAPVTGRLAELTGQAPAGGAAILRRSKLQWVLLWGAWMLLVLALVRPQWLEDPIVEELPMRDLLLAVDLSGSMDTEDFTDAEGDTTDRLSAVKQVLADFLAKRDGDRVALVFFGSAPFVQAPFTADLEVVGELLDEARVRMLGPRTMLGDAMGLALNLFERSEVEERVMIVLTDGNDTGSLVPPEHAARIARDEGVTVHTVAIGDPEAAGEQALDEATLKEVARVTGGGFYRAGNRDEMAAIYTELDQLNPRKVQSTSYRPRRDLYPWPLGAALALSLAFHILAPGRRRMSGAAAVGVADEAEGTAPEPGADATAEATSRERDAA